MKGRVLGVFIVASAAATGISVWYLQVHAYYQEVTAPEILLTSAATGKPERIPVEDVSAIDAQSSPLRYRACFMTRDTQTMLRESYVKYTGAVPLNAPRWFDCFDAAELGAALGDGQAVALLGEAGIHEGVDRVVAVFADGRAFSWHQLSEEYRN